MTIPGIKYPAVPYGSFVVISGVSDFIGSHVADQALAAGYKFKTKYGPNNFELIEVPDMAAEGAFDKAARGATGFVHVAQDMAGSADPSVVVPRAVNGVLNALKAAANEPLMKRFVYTSSSFAVTFPKPGRRFTVTAAMFNDEAVERAWGPNPEDSAVYACSKVEAERAISKWVEDHKPSLVVNTIQPNANIGPIISYANQGYPTSSQWVKALWNMDYESLKRAPAQHFINVQDDARLHIIALANPAVQGERIFAIAGPVNHNDIIKILRKNYPQRQWEDFPDNEQDLSVIEPMKRAEELLQEAYEMGFISLEESVKANAAGLVEG
ncbi:Aldehyde reductase [Fusarium falciforme]|uniref:Aldehyde reductase n=1 Tax=Fusarium falciforme TaxID=195108 RepID=UPI002301A84C|nr:Aldehyde reductase [Fusarium falciforme]WAO95968.1 Aldehyde reductase [Fusarium falciforme]